MTKEITNRFQIICKDGDIIDALSSIFIKNGIKNFSIVDMGDRHLQLFGIWIIDTHTFKDYALSRKLTYEFSKTNDLKLRNNVKGELPDYFTIKDLKDLIKNLPDDLPVGTSGHFGEFHPMDKYDFDICITRPIPKNKMSWRDALNDEIKILQINSPDIGPSPD